MPNSTRINGTKLYLKFGTTDYSTDLLSYNLEDEDADSSTVTFADAAAGGKFLTKLSGSAIQSTDSASFWSYVWANVGQTIAFTLAPWGNSSATAAQPLFTGNVKIGKRPSLGGEASIKGQDFTFDFEWECVGSVTKTP